MVSWGEKWEMRDFVFFFLKEPFTARYKQTKNLKYKRERLGYVMYKFWGLISHKCNMIQEIQPPDNSTQAAITGNITSPSK